MIPKRPIFALIVFLCIIVIIEIYIKLPSKPLSTTHDAIRHEALVNHHKTEVQLTEDDSEVSEVSVIVLWWTSFIDGLEYTKNCGNHICRFTGNRKYLNHAKTKTLLFYGSNMDVGALPLPRDPKHIWALFHEESPKNKPLLMYRSALELFNLTATFSQYSNFPLTAQYLESYEKLIDLQYFVGVEEKNRLQSNENIAPVLYLQSICDTMSDRDAYVAELMKHIRIDSFGKCLNNNKAIPKSLSGDDYLSTIQTEEMYRFIARYKFVISFENSVCDDYITEKLWRPLSLGVVPIYFGSPNILQWLPNRDSIVQIQQFQSPKKLAEHILLLNNNDELYNRMLEHKIQQNVSNAFLKDMLQQRKYEINSIVEDFECFVCQQSVDDMESNAKSNRSKQAQNMCPDQLVYPKMRSHSNKRDDWQAIWNQGRCEADVLNELLRRNEKFTQREFDQNLLDKINNRVCELI